MTEQPTNPAPEPTEASPLRWGLDDALDRQAAAEQQDQAADRRERYAAAIRENDGWVLDDGQHMIDAVMAVAAAEQAAAVRRALDDAADGLDEDARRLNHPVKSPTLTGAAYLLRARAAVAAPAREQEARPCGRQMAGRCSAGDWCCTGPAAAAMAAAVAAPAREQASPVDWEAIARQRERELKAAGEARHRAEVERDAVRRHADPCDGNCGTTILECAVANDVEPPAREQGEARQPEQLTDADRQFFGFALDLADDRMSSRDGFTDDDHAALAKLRRIAAGQPVSGA